jgi:sodium/hydrogen antiporter
MAWSQLRVSEINMILIFFGLFMMLFMLTSRLTQSKFHIGAANVAFIAGIVFGPRAATLLNPLPWHNLDSVVMEVTRIVLVAQCFANGVELPAFYLNSAWKSLSWILGPAMLFGWTVCSCCVKLMIPSLEWRQAIACAACFNAIDPILAATVLQQALHPHWRVSVPLYKRMPGWFRNLLRAEAACNGLTTTLVLDVAIYTLRYQNSTRNIIVKSLLLGLLYDILLSIAIGAAVGFGGRRMLFYFESRGWVDRPSFLAFYLALAIFCAGVGSIVGTDDILLAFFAGYCLDYDDRYQRRTEESGLSATIDLLLNLTFYVFIGSIVPWPSFNSVDLDIVPWRLVVGTLAIFLLRRIPIFMFLNWCKLLKEFTTLLDAIVYGHFGPIGGGAIFAALLIRAQSTPGADKVTDGSAITAKAEKYLDQVWAVTTFVVVCSSLVHGSTITVVAISRWLKVLRIEIEFEDDHNSGDEHLTARTVELPEIHIDPPEDEEEFRSRKLRPSQISRKNSVAVETILRDIEDGFHLVVEGPEGEQIKKYVIRQDSRSSSHSKNESHSSSSSRIRDFALPEGDPSHDSRSRRGSLTGPLHDLLGLANRRYSTEEKGKAVMR